MLIPKIYIHNLKKHIITEKMLEDALFSVNKRAKNWRDKAREYSANGNIEQAEYATEKKEKCYQQKDDLLTLLKPTCIHREEIGEGPDDIQYYLFYTLGSHSFHSPISTVENYDLPIVEVKELATEGHDPEELLPLSCVSDIIKLIHTGDFTYLENPNKAPLS